VQLMVSQTGKTKPPTGDCLIILDDFLLFF
jgi:hypothetical protein